MIVDVFVIFLCSAGERIFFLNRVLVQFPNWSNICSWGSIGGNS